MSEGGVLNQVIELLNEAGFENWMLCTSKDFQWKILLSAGDMGDVAAAIHSALVHESDLLKQFQEICLREKPELPAEVSTEVH